MSDIQLNVNGTLYGGWETVDITLSMENLAGTFTISVSDSIDTSGNPISALPIFIPGSTCEVLLNGEVIITGYLDKVMPGIDARSHSITINGRDKTGDLVDCSMIAKTSQWKDLNALQIITRICEPFGVTVSAESDVGEPFKNFLIEQGSTCFETIQKICYMRQLLAISDGEGGLILTRAGSDQSGTAIIQGINLLKGDATYDTSELFSKYLCKGQKQGDDQSTPETVASNYGEADDSLVGRYRPLMVLAEGQATIKNCTDRAKWEAAVRRGKSKKYSVTVNGWSQERGDLWKINRLVQIDSSVLGVKGTFLISEINFKLDDNGEITVLTITSKDAYAVDPSGTQRTIDKDNPYLGGAK